MSYHADISVSSDIYGTEVHEDSRISWKNSEDDSEEKR